MPADTIVDLASDEGKRLISELQRAEITVLVGSGISSFGPTSLPTGMALGKAISERLADGGVSDRDLLVKILSDTAFEHVMERCPDQDRIREVLSRRFSDVPPNNVHRAFVRLMQSGTIRHVVTTNYDVGLEAAFRELFPLDALAMVRCEQEAVNAQGDPRHVLFKIHGCATPPLAEEMVFRLTDEAQLDGWKRQVLRTVVEGRALLVVAYSGMDFEICPELPRMGASRLVWLHFGALKWMTPNAWRVVRQSGGVLLQGNVLDLAAMLLGEERVEADWSPATADAFAKDLFSGFDDEDLDAWRARLFGEIGCARDAIAAADRLLARANARNDRAARGRALSHRGRGLFHQGRYMEAAAEYSRSARIFRDAGDAQELRGALNGIVESNRCAGRMARIIPARIALRRLERRSEDDREQAAARADTRMLGSLVWRHAYQLASLIPRRRGLRRLRKRLRASIRERARRDIAEVATFAADAGNWLQLQQAKLWTKRYGLHWNSVFQGTMDPLPSREGYRQLGYVVAHSMALRDERKPPDPEEVSELLEALVGVQAWPEAWKLARFAEQHLGPSYLPPHLRDPIEHGWRACQYTAWMRYARQKGIF